MNLCTARQGKAYSIRSIGVVEAPGGTGKNPVSGPAARMCGSYQYPKCDRDAKVWL